uniref:Uncharacterized protein n=1 Tax=uncultured prokaryote TaxID=198431 RepID=A0A0H5Q7N1_9ZZZZ|nr:hypothetical protein [uncultured prokaryote]
MAEMWKIQTIVTGVAGSPYFIVGYFDATEISDQAAVAAWHSFTTNDSSALGIAQGATYTTGTETAIVESTTGLIVGFTATTPASITGSSTEPLCPPASQILVRWGTATVSAGRRVRGHTNLPLVKVSDLTSGGNLQAGEIADRQGNVTSLLAAAGGSFVIYSRKNRIAAPVVSGSVWNELAVLRSRRD